MGGRVIARSDRGRQIIEAFTGARRGAADHAYYVWVDRFNTLGLGTNVPIATTNGGESLLALVNGRFVNLRIPYPMGFFSKNVDGRIDDMNGGWKGRGLWTTSGTRAVFHGEGGKERADHGNSPSAVSEICGRAPGFNGLGIGG